MKFANILAVFAATATATHALPNAEASEAGRFAIARRQGLVTTILDQAVTLVEEVVTDLEQAAGPDIKTDVGLLEQVLADLDKAIKDLI